VIGSGIAGLSAAVSACDAGARVTILERSTEEEYGGNTRWTEAYFRMTSESEVSDDFEESLVGNAGYHLDPNIISAMGGAYSDWPSYVKSHGMPDPELIGALSENAGPTVHWLKTFGVHFEALPTYFITAAAPRLMPVGGGSQRADDMGERADAIDPLPLAVGRRSMILAAARAPFARTTREIVLPLRAFARRSCAGLRTSRTVFGVRTALLLLPF
jgi:choline dehydrogenase-like flavoprotein